MHLYLDNGPRHHPGTMVKDKLRARHTELAAGVRTTGTYIVGQCLKDWLETLTTKAEITVTGYRIMARHPAGPIGHVKLADLKVRDVQFALGTLAERWSSRSVMPDEQTLSVALRSALVVSLRLRVPACGGPGGT